MKKILMITTMFPPSHAVGTQRSLRICKYLDKSKWEIHVLTLKEKYYGGLTLGNISGINKILETLHVYRTDKVDILSVLVRIKESVFHIKPKVPCQPTMNHCKPDRPAGFSLLETIRRAGSVITDLMVFPDQEIAWLPLAVPIGCYITLNRGIDIVFSSSPMHSFHLIAAIITIITGKKLVIEFRDPWARSPWREEERKSTRFERFKHRIIKKLEKWVVEKADRVICVTQEMRDDFAQHYGYLPADKFKVFYNGYDPDHIRPLVSDNQATSKVIFSHIGALYKRRDPSPLIYAVKNLKDQHQISDHDVLFYFIGPIADELSSIKELVVRLGVDKMIVLIPPVSFEKSLEYMAQSDILILLQPDTRVQIPGKFYDYICFEKPIFAVGEKNSAVETMVRDRFGIFADCHHTKEIEDGIMAFITMMRSSHDFANTIRANREAYNISETIKLFEQLLSSVC